MFHQFVIKYFCTWIQPISVAGRSKACVCSRSLAGITGSNPTRVHGYISLVIVVCCQVEVPASSWSPVQIAPTVYRACWCDLEALIMKRPWPQRGFVPGRKIKTFIRILQISLICHSFCFLRSHWILYSPTQKHKNGFQVVIKLLWLETTTQHCPSFS